MHPTPEVVATRLKGSFATAYLTLTSIIQGVAFSVLTARVQAHYEAFDATDWVLAVATFVGLATVWHEYLMQSLAFVWMPNLLDSLVPFAFLATELFSAHFVFHALHGWLVATGLSFVVGVCAQRLTVRQASLLPAENRALLDAIAPHVRVRAVVGVVIAVAGVGLGAGYTVLGLGRSPLLVACLVLLAMIAFLVSSVPYWNAILAYSRTAPASALRAP